MNRRTRAFLHGAQLMSLDGGSQRLRDVADRLYRAPEPRSWLVLDAVSAVSRAAWKAWDTVLENPPCDGDAGRA